MARLGTRQARRFVCPMVPCNSGTEFETGSCRRMKEDGVSLPELVAEGPIIPVHLMNELDSSKVVFFCGAGISAGPGSELPGYGVRVCRTGRKVYMVQARGPGGDGEGGWAPRNHSAGNGQATGSGPGRPHQAGGGARNSAAPAGADRGRSGRARHARPLGGQPACKRR